MAEILSRADSSNGAGDISRGIGKPGNRGTGKGEGDEQSFCIAFPYSPILRRSRYVREESCDDGWFWLRANYPVDQLSVLEY